MRIFGLKNCDNCRKAQQAFPEAELVDIRTEGLPDDLLAKAHAVFGDKLVNTRSTTWRGLDEEARKAPPLDLLVAHPTLMKRPLIAVGNELFLGWNKGIEADIKAMH